MSYIFAILQIVIHYRSFEPNVEGINATSLRQNGWHFANSTLKYILLNENCQISIQLQWNLFLQGSNKQSTSICSDNGLMLNRRHHYLNQWWPYILIYICMTWAWWVKHFISQTAVIRCYTRRYYSLGNTCQIYIESRGGTCEKYHMKSVNHSSQIVSTYQGGTKWHNFRIWKLLLFKQTLHSEPVSLLFEYRHFVLARPDSLYFMWPQKPVLLFMWPQKPVCTSGAHPIKLTQTRATMSHTEGEGVSHNSPTHSIQSHEDCYIQYKNVFK